MEGREKGRKENKIISLIAYLGVTHKGTSVLPTVPLLFTGSQSTLAEPKTKMTPDPKEPAHLKGSFGALEISCRRTPISRT